MERVAGQDDARLDRDRASGDPVGVDHGVGPAGSRRGRDQEGREAAVAGNPAEGLGEGLSAPILEEPPGFIEHAVPGDAQDAVVAAR